MDRKSFVAALANLRPNSTFLSIVGYRNEHGELSDQNIVFHMSYNAALRSSIVALSSMSLIDPLDIRARNELVLSFKNSLEKIAYTPIEELDDGYTRFYDENAAHIKGIKLHNTSNTLHIYGLVVSKTIREPGNYKHVNSSLNTIHKNKLRRRTPVGNFRQYRITPEQVEWIKVENLKLLPPKI